MKTIATHQEGGLVIRARRTGPNLDRGQGDATSSKDSSDCQIDHGNSMSHRPTDNFIHELIDRHVTQSSRSRSLPNCVSKREDNIGRPITKGVQCDVLKGRPLTMLTCDVMPSVCDKGKSDLKCEGGIANDTWYKTWPETRNNVVSNVQMMTNTSTTTKGESQSESILPESNNCDHNRTCNLSTQTSNNSSNGNRSRSAIPLDQLLQSIPLAYSPITRQLHVLTPVPAPAAELPDVLAMKLQSIEEHNESLGCVGKNGSPFSSLSSLSGAELCGPSTPSNDDDSSDNTSNSIMLDANFNPSAAGRKLKQGSFSNFFSRSLFTWKLGSKPARESVSLLGNGGPSWKLFNRSPSRQENEKEMSGLDEACSLASSSSGATSLSGSIGGGCGPGPGGGSHVHVHPRFQSLEASSGALILEPRPAHLPAKSQEEEQRHRLEYHHMVQAARKKELKEANLRKKQLQQQLRAEDQLAQAAKIWSSEVLPKWESMKNCRKARELWWQGLPPSVRGRVWRLAVGNELNLTPDLYDICKSRFQERLRAFEGGMLSSQNKDSTERCACEESCNNPDKESSMELIQLDIARTFPLLCIFQKGGPYYDVLHSLLGAYVCYRPDVGYVQGMSFLAAVLILNLEAADAFVCFANLLNRPCQRAFFHLDEPMMAAYYAAYNEILQESLPRLHRHFLEQGLTPDLYLLDWLYTMYSRSMPLDVACRVWDVYLRDGEEFLFRTALGVLQLYQDSLLDLDFLHGAQFLTKLPDDLPSEALFRCIEGVRMCVGKLKFADVLVHQIELVRVGAELS